MSIKYYIKGTLGFKPNCESSIGLYIGDSLVKILSSHHPGKFKIQFNNGDKISTDMVTPVDLYIDGFIIIKSADKDFLIQNGRIGDFFYYRLRACNDGIKTLTIKKSTSRDRKTLHIDKFGEWYVPPGYNYVLGYIY